MSDSTVAQRYALAMIDIADEAKAIDQIGADLLRFADVVEVQDSALLKAFANPGFSPEERANVLAEVLPLVAPHPLCNNLLKLLNQKGRLSAIRAIATTYQHLADERAGRLKVLVETAEPLTPELELELQQTLTRATGKEVVLEKRPAPELIGGLVAHVAGRVYDSSLRTHLTRIRAALLKAHDAGNA
jgi:F-type H+-transporting ATPase subunit delta